ncbi:MAG TPA: Tm-1-like ATP-binding domain-containing protein [Spirochaetia bacterium]|nr:Tm-1-like ATP-binding domain-containing protein [Spirochaetia bacterium]
MNTLKGTEQSRLREQSGRGQIAILGTVDTKREAIQFVKQTISDAGFRVVVIDTSVASKGSDAEYGPETVLSEIGVRFDDVSKFARGEAVEIMCKASRAFLTKLVLTGPVRGIIGIGGSGGTTICTYAMRELPYGVPKVVVSTLASGNTRWHVDTSDIVMIPSLLDISGLNPMIEMVLRNACYAVCGMVTAASSYQPSGRRVLATTMYGTTTAGVSNVREGLEHKGCEVWTFHASGIGGKTMERLIRQGSIAGVIDMTLAEIGSHIVGGLHDAGAERMDAAGMVGLPQVVVPGAADTIVLPPKSEVPAQFRGRTLSYHNPTMTTMRTTAEENREIARFIAKKLNASSGTVRVVLPLGGVSSLDRPTMLFYDPQANDALFSELKADLDSKIPIVESGSNINDPEFADLVLGVATDLFGL